MTETKVSVVVPFFQREKGILKRAVQSVLDQKHFNNYEIIVVDDGSPVSANEEIAELIETTESKIRVIRQKNAGPGAARNKGLDSVSKETTYVAFLDSDDQWVDSHLDNAVTALDKGYDFYFANRSRENYSWEKSFYNQEKYQSSCMIIDMERQLYEFRGDFFDSLLLESYVLTSTVVYRFERFLTLRFREEFFNGQDLLFWIDFSRLSRKICFSAFVECHYGKGVSICSGSGWDSDRALTYLCNRMQISKFISKEYLLTPRQRKIRKQKINLVRCEFIVSLLHEVKKRKRLQWNILSRQLKLDFLTYVYLLPNLIKLTVKKIAF